RLLPRATIRELMEFLHGLYPKPLPVDEVLDLADLTSLQKRTVERLSGGQAQRVRFAMALVGQPDLLVLDEPTAALDVEARRDLEVTGADLEEAFVTLTSATRQAKASQEETAR